MTDKEIADLQIRARQAVKQLAAQLLSVDNRLCAAESCTGGLLAMLCTEVSGSSRWFERGFVTYSNEAKQQMLGVSEQTLITQGAVSEATAAEMVRGALTHSLAEYAVAITGIAGPTGGSAAKPVGTVCFGFTSNAGQERLVTCCFKGDRQQVRWQSAVFALEQLLELTALSSQ